jgi:urease accessory protein
MSRVTGCIAASFAEAGGQTRLSDRYHAYPLKIAKAFPFDHGQLGVYVMDASPGILAGDEYVMDWKFGDNTQVYITNQSYTKVHPARCADDDASGARPSGQQLRLHLGPGSYVEYMPEPLMLYKDAILCSSVDIRLEPGAALIYSDALCPGRTQRGELFQYELYQNRVAVTYGDELIFSSKQRVQPARQKLRAIGAWAGYTHAGSLYVFSDLAELNAVFIDRLREFLDERLQAGDFRIGDTEPESETGRRDGGELIYGVSRTYKHGLVLNAAGHKIYELQSLLEAAWQFVREQLFGKAPLHIRK